METYTLADFDRWQRQLAATGYRPTNPQEIARIRQILAAGGTMTVPVKVRP